MPTGHITTSEPSALGREKKLVKVFWHLLVLSAGVVAYVVGHWGFVSEVWRDPLKNLGVVLAGGTLLFFVLEWSSDRLFATVLDDYIGRSLDGAVVKLFGKQATRAHQNANVDYRWRCWLFRPPSGDSFPGYLYQRVQISYFHPGLPREVVMVLGYSNENRATEAYFRDDCLLRWPSSFLDHAPLKIEDPACQSLESLQIGGVLLKPRKKVVDIPGGRACEYRFAVPDAQVGNRALVEFLFTVRKIDAPTIAVTTRLFKEAVDAEFVLFLDSSLNASQVFPYTDEIKPTVETRIPVVTGNSFVRGGPSTSWARYTGLADKGSAVKFEVRVASLPNTPMNADGEPARSRSA